MFLPVRISGLLKTYAFAFAALTGVTSYAGSTLTYDTKDSPVVEIPTSAPVVRESRGLITLEGPSGMFLNPTSATLPQGAFDAGYCLILTDRETKKLGNSFFFSYGVRDWLELGVVAGMANIRTTTDQDFPREGNYGDAGPMIRVRLLRDRNCWPEISLGAYAKWGTDQLDSSNVYLAASKTLPIDENGFLKTVTFQGGFRESWIEAPDRTTHRFYGGLEVQLPHNFYLVGEVTQFAKRKDDFTPWAGGIQWRGRHFGVTAAAVQSGDDRPYSIYLGIGSGLGVEPVRIPTRPVARP
jgi:exopolysaccharide biosynthesis protein YbjH